MTDQKAKETKKRGRKPGAPHAGGMPKGHITAKTLQKEEGKALLREMVLSELRPIVRGLIGKATGINHMMLRDETNGQWIRLTEPEQIEKALNAKGAEEGKTYWIHTKDPDVQAAADVLNRAIGKPVEEVQVEHSGSVTVTERLKRARERARG